MTKYLTNNFAVINLHKSPSSKSEVVTQMIYGDSFSISKKTRKWLKVKIKEYVPKRKFFDLGNIIGIAIEGVIDKIEEKIKFQRFGL